MKFPYKIILNLSLLCFLLNSCIFSLHPLWTQENRVFDEALVGLWYEGDCEDPKTCSRIEFEASGDTAYIMTQYDNWDLFGSDQSSDSLIKTQFIATLIQLGKHHFLDLYPEGESIEDRFSENYFPVHSFHKIRLGSNQLSLSSLDGERLSTLFEQRRIRIRYETVGDFTVLTASSEELAAFMEKYADDPNAFEEPSPFVRK